MLQQTPVSACNNLILLTDIECLVFDRRFETSVDVELGFTPSMSLSSMPPPAYQSHDTTHNELPTPSTVPNSSDSEYVVQPNSKHEVGRWHEFIHYEDAKSRLELQFYPFKKVKSDIRMIIFFIVC